MKFSKIYSKITLIVFLIIIFSLLIGVSYAEEDVLNSSIYENNIDPNIKPNFNSNISNNFNSNAYSNSIFNNSNNSTPNILSNSIFNNSNNSTPNILSNSIFNNSNNSVHNNFNNLYNGNDVNLINTSGTVFANGDEIYVSTSGDDSNDGYTPETAKRTINAALDAVDNGGTIHILGGTYEGPGNVGLTINKNVTIIGNTTVQDVIIDGGNNNRIMTIGNNVNLEIQNIRFINGRTSTYGGVIYSTGLNMTLNITLINCNFTNNYASLEGGAIYLYSGILSNRTNLTTINCNFINNTAGLYGGAISLYYGNRAYIENSTFNNNTATYSGAIDSNQIDVTMINSNFTGNRATVGHGGVMNHDLGSNNINVINCIFTNNSCQIDGGVFRVSALARLNINNSVFTSNFAGNDLNAEGGAIYSEGGVVTVRNSNFTSNGAYLRGGAIGSYSFLPNAGLFIYGCNFVNNYVTQNSSLEASNTILIWGIHPVEINYNRFYNNTGSRNNYVVFVHDALSNADLSYNWWGDNQLPLANTLALNEISNYFVVDVVFDSVSNGVANFNYVIRLNNSGNFNLSMLPIFYGNSSTNPNFYNGNFTAYIPTSINIPLNGNYGNITFNFRVDNWNKSIIILVKADTLLIFDPIADTTYGDTVPITGRLITINGTPIAGVPVTININGFNYTIITESDGTFSLNYTINSTGLINVIGEFLGTDDFLATSNMTYFNVILFNTSITIDPIPDTSVGDIVVINGTLLDSNGNPLSNNTVNVFINGFLYSTTTDANGRFNVTYIVNTTGVIEVCAQFLGNERYSPSSNITYFNGVHHDTTILIDDIANTQVGNTIPITGILLDENSQPIANANITININGFDYIVQTNSSGGFTLNYNVNTTGTINVFVHFFGNETYSPSSNSTSFLSSRINTTIIIDPIPDTSVNESVNITGTLVDESNNPIANANITIIINGTNYNITTNSSGEFILNYLVIAPGPIGVIYIYEGNDTYEPSNNFTSFNSFYLDTNIVIDSIPNTKIGNNVTVSGVLIDANGNEIANANITIIIDGVFYNVTTDISGRFTLNHALNNSGTISVIVSYEGSMSYNPSTNSTTFEGLKLNSTIIIDNINNTNIGNDVNITGTLVDENNNIIPNANITITIDGISYDVTTDNSGRFTLNYTVNTTGIISVLYEYYGDSTFYPSSNETSFESLKLSTIIVIDNINDTKIGNNVTINGTLVDGNNNPIPNANITVTIDGTDYLVSTDENGRFSFNYTLNRTGTIPVSFMYLGNVTFEAALNETSFIGLRLDTNIIFDQINNTKINDTAVISGTLIDEYGRPVANARVNIFVNGFLYVDLTDENGRFSFNYPVTNSVTVSVLGTFPGTEIFAPSTNTTSFNGLHLNSNLIFDPIENVTINDTIIINGTLIGENNNPIANVNITVTVNGTDYVVLTDENGRFSLPYFVGDELGLFIVNGVFSGNMEYDYSYNSTSFFVNKIPTNLSVLDVSGLVGDELNMTANLTDNNGDPIVGKNVTFYININGNYIPIGTAITDVNGIARIQYTFSNGGVYEILAVFLEDGIYLGSNNTGLAIIISIDRTNITVENISGSVGDTVNLTARLIDSYGNPLVNRTIDFYVDGMFIGSAITNTNGIARIQYTFSNGGVYEILAVFLEDGIYLGSNNTGLAIIISIDRTNITVENISGSVGDTVNLTARLIDSYGNPLVNRTIDFYVDGRYIGSNLTDTEGVAKYHYLITSSGSYIIEAVFRGDNYTAPSNGYGDGNFSPGETHITIGNIKGKIGDYVYLTAKLTDKNGRPLSNKVVNFYVDGMFIGSAITNTNGIARLLYKITNENFTITAIFEGDSDYLRSENSRNFIVHSNKTPKPISSNIQIPKSSQKSHIGIKKTGIPINIIVILLLSILGIMINRKKN